MPSAPATGLLTPPPTNLWSLSIGVVCLDEVCLEELFFGVVFAFGVIFLGWFVLKKEGSCKEGDGKAPLCGVPSTLWPKLFKP